jgi:hypothetical protein
MSSFSAYLTVRRGILPPPLALYLYVTSTEMRRRLGDTEFRNFTSLTVVELRTQTQAK